jgi:hypothetical protein
VDAISDHYDQLVIALRAHDMVRAAFEAAWLAHAIVDGLTPAHHFPYEAELASLRGGSGNETRASLKEKLVLPGETRREQLSNNWKMWGTKGLMTTHGAFEWGFATIVLPMRFKQRAAISQRDVARLRRKGVDKWFRSQAQSVAKLKLYDKFYEDGWNRKLTKVVRRKLAPTIVKAVAIAWAAAVVEAEKT